MSLTNKTSISDYESYKNACQNAADNDDAFNIFKTNREYTTILEHANYDQGLGYIEYLNNTQLDLAKLPLLKSNDLQGGATLYSYPEPYGEISPSTLRYIKVLAELEQMFGSLEDKHIVEIGVGYGGQCKVINDYFKVSSYTLVDLPEALALSKRYLRDYNYSNVYYFEQKNLPQGKQYDLLISNYAFSECERTVQTEYINVLLKNSVHGYITFNNISQIFNVDSLSRSEFSNVFPCSEKPEIPLTGDNNIYYW